MSLPTMIDDLVFAIETGYAEWGHVINGLSEAQCLPPNFIGLWTIKDIIAHVSWYEQQMEQLVSNHSMDTEGGELWNLPTDDRNAKIYALYKDMSLDEVKAMAAGRHESMLSAMRKLKDVDVTDPTRYQGMEPDWSPADIIAQNTWLHYADHLIMIKRML